MIFVTGLQAAFGTSTGSKPALTLRFHDLRHTFGSRLATHGVSLQIIARALGHTSARMSERYTRPSDEALRSVASALDASISNSAANSQSGGRNAVANGKRASDGAGALYLERVMGIEPTTFSLGKLSNWLPGSRRSVRFC